MLYYSYIHSHIIYGLFIWGPLIAKSNLKRITVSQKKAVRIVSNSSYNSTTSPIFKSLKILKIEDMINVELTKFGYLFTKSQLPTPLMSLFKPNSNNHRYYTRGRNYPRIEAHTLRKKYICDLTITYVV